jgi:hypothetical protein
MPALPVMVRPGLMGLPALRSHVMAELAAWAELAARAVILELAELEAVATLGQAVAVVWAWRAVAALEAVAALVALGLMRAASTTVRLVVMADRAALVDRVGQLAPVVRMRLPS